MEEKKWKPGDVVMLKTGGWPMTVERLWEMDKVDCVWFERIWMLSDSGRTDRTTGGWLWSGPHRERFTHDSLVESKPLED